MRLRQQATFISMTLLAGAWVSPVVAGAADSEAQPATPAAAARDAGALEEVVVTARKRDESLQQVPVAETAFSATDVVGHEITSINDLSQLTPSLTFQQSPYSPFASLPGIRGQRASDTVLSQSPAIGVYVDDVYQATSLGTAAFSMEDVRNIEVLKGPQGTLYGRNTTGGAIKITTALPDYNGFSGAVKVGGGNYGENEQAASANIVLADNTLALRMTADHLAHDGYGRDLTNHRDLADEGTTSVRAALRFDPSSNLAFVLRGDWSNAQSGGVVANLGAIVPPFSPTGTPNFTPALMNVGLGIGAINFADIAPLLAPAIYGPPTPANIAHVLAGEGQAYQALLPFLHQGYNVNYSNVDSAHLRSSGGSLTVTYGPTDDLTLKSISAYRSAYQYTSVDADATPFVILEGPASIVNMHQLTQELQLAGAMLDKTLKYTAGYYYFHMSGADDSYPEVELPYLNPMGSPVNILDDLTDESNSVYGQATYEVLPKVHFTAGARWTAESTGLIAHSTAGPQNACNLPPPAGSGANPCVATFDHSFHNTSYTAGLDWSVTDDTLLYVRTSSGFKAGGQNERGSTAGGFDAFTPETVRDYEVGAKTEFFDHRLRINAAVYHSDYNDIQRTVLAITPTGQSITEIRNAGKAKIDGAELEVTARPVPEITLHAGLAYTHPRYITYFVPSTGQNLAGDAFQDVPLWQGSFSAAYLRPVSFGSVGVTIDYSYQSKVFLEPDNLTIYSNNSSIQAGYGLVNARASLRIERYDLELAAWGKNLTDKRYVTGSGDFTGLLGIGTSYLSAPRTFGVEVTKRF